MDIQDVLTALSIDGRWQSEQFIARCPFHEDHNPSFGANQEGLWLCRAGCGEGNLPQLVSRVRGISMRDAREWLEQPLSPRAFTKEAVQRKVRRKVSAPTTRYLLPPYVDTQVPGWVLERGFSKEILRRYKVGYCAATDSLVIPVLGNNPALIYRRQPGQTPKYKHTAGFASHKTLWGLFGFEMGQGDTIILVEGPLDALWLRQHGYNNALAILGAGHLGKEQARIIKEELKPACVVLVFDNDEAGVETTRKTTKMLKGTKTQSVDWAEFPDRKDPADLDPDEISQLLSTARPSVL